MELLMQEFHMYLLDIKSSPKLNGEYDNKEMSSIRLNLLTKTTWKLKTPGGILVFRLLVQVCLHYDEPFKGVIICQPLASKRPHHNYYHHHHNHTYQKNSNHHNTHHCCHKNYLLFFCLLSTIRKVSWLLLGLDSSSWGSNWGRIEFPVHCYTLHVCWPYQGCILTVTRSHLRALVTRLAFSARIS
jgi:hypothetical protein